MAMLIDPPFWPAHGTLWSHLISDSNHDELHEFARHLPLPRRSFDLDHYDVPQQHYERAVLAGAVPVSAKDLVRSLRSTGLRLPQPERELSRPVARKAYLTAEWDRLGRTLQVAEIKRWSGLGEELLARWSQPHRHYHDDLHLEDVLLALDHLGTMGEILTPDTLLAAWFHDAVYEGAAGDDERASADYASIGLGGFGLDPGLIARVHSYIMQTIPATQLSRASRPLAHLLDADLAIFGAGAKRYLQYTQQVRAEYAHVPEAIFRAGRSKILEGYLAKPAIFHTSAARALWEEAARRNLSAEIEVLAA